MTISSIGRFTAEALFEDARAVPSGASAGLGTPTFFLNTGLNKGPVELLISDTLPPYRTAFSLALKKYYQVL
jgi:hypothetical protein